jgi:UDP-N-acetylglucosamine 2-epimerase (non-hydrolysing)
MREIKFLDTVDLRPEIGITIGTRPGIVMLAPVIHEFRRRGLPHFVIHTGQHYSPNMDAQFFTDLELPAPDYRIEGVAEKRTHGGQTAAMLEGVEKILMERRPFFFLVGGDANTNLAAALAARKLRISLGHIEAGERCYDWQVPEEHNRVMIDHISEHLFATSEQSAQYLRREQVLGKIHVVGNPKVDASKQFADIALRTSAVFGRYVLVPGSYAVLTAHREENVDVADKLRGLLQGVSDAARALGLPVLFPAHPRTIKRLGEFGLTEWAAALPQVMMTEAVGYLDFLALLAKARLVFTDSGGVQQEACIHHVPCVTLLDSTEWTETLAIGANRLAGCDPDRIVAAARAAFGSDRNWPALFGDGTTAQQIADVSEQLLNKYRRTGRPPGVESAIAPQTSAGRFF